MDHVRVEAEGIAASRLDLVPLQVGHAEEMARVLGDPVLYVFIGGGPFAPAALRARYQRLLAGSPHPEVSWCNWVLRLRAEECLVGTVQATIGPNNGALEAELSWLIGAPWQGRGYAIEAAEALVGWLAERGADRAIAHIHPAHEASARVAAAAGLAPTGEWQDDEVRWRRELAQ